MGRKFRHESDHAAERARERRISEAERLKLLTDPDEVKLDGNYRLHYDHTTRNFVSLCAVIAVGAGTAILTRNPIFGLSAGSFCTIVTYYLTKKPKR